MFTRICSKYGKMKMENNMFLTLVTVILAALVYNSSSTRVDSTCYFSKDGVWTCNYIPSNISDGVIKVHIELLRQTNPLIEINRTHFKSETWHSVKYLKITDITNSGKVTFKDDTFGDFTQLEELHLNLATKVYLEPYSLSGLENVRILDFSGCVRLNLAQVMGALNCSEKVPNLEQLLMSQISYFRSLLKIDREFSRCLSQKPLIHIDLSKTRISLFELEVMKDLGHLKKLNMSGADISDSGHKNAMPLDFRHLEILDFSYISGILFPSSDAFNFSISNVNVSFKNRGHHYSFFVSPEILNISGINSKNIFVNNIKLRSLVKFKSWTKEIILRQNSLRHLDIEWWCDNLDLNSIELINLASNGLEYIHPSVFGCMPNLADLDVSHNNLNVMYVKNIHLFGQLLNDARSMKCVNLAFNQFGDIPEDFFHSNDLLEIINLSGNRLTQVHFRLDHLQKLHALHLANNNIKVLDEASMKYLDALAAAVKLGGANIDTGTETTYKEKLEVVIKANPLMCDTCDKKAFISWLSMYTPIDTMFWNVTCRSETGEPLIANTEAEAIVQQVCDRNTRNLIFIILTVLFCLVFMCVAFFVYMRRKHLRNQRKQNDVINVLRNNVDRFAVFLSYCSDDENFVKENIVEPLNEGLQRIIGTDRNLVCQGDTQFRLGRYVHNEAMRCIELVTVVLSVISNSYCNSNYCESEFNQALQLNKPVLLLMKDEVDVELMIPTMQALFRDKVRVLWEYENEQYRLKTSWENVCESILDLASD